MPRKVEESMIRQINYCGLIRYGPAFQHDRVGVLKKRIGHRYLQIPGVSLFSVRRKKRKTNRLIAIGRQKFFGIPELIVKSVNPPMEMVFYRFSKSVIGSQGVSMAIESECGSFHPAADPTYNGSVILFFGIHITLQGIKSQYDLHGIPIRIGKSHVDPSRPIIRKGGC